MGLLGEMTVRFSADVTGLNSGISQATSMLGSFAATPVGAIVTGLVAVTGAAVSVGAASVTAAADFQQSMLKVSAYAGLSKQQTDAMSNSILNMASQLGQSPKAMADAIYPIISSGYSASQALNILSLSAKTAAASGAQMSTVADMLTTSLKASGAPASDAGHYMDMFNKIVSLGKGEVPQYAAVIGKLTLAAQSAKVPFDEMGGALATLTTHGFPSVAQASTALGNLFTQIGPKVDALTAHAKALGISFDENKFKTLDLAGKLDYLQQVTGGNQGELLKLLGGSTLALKAFTALSGSTADFTSNLEAMKNATGATDAAFQTASSGFNASMARMHASIDVLMIKIGQALLPVLTSIVNTVTPIITSFANWEVQTHGIENAIAAVIAVIRAVSTGIAALTAFFQSNSIQAQIVKALLIGIGVALATIGIGAFIAAIPALVAGFIAWATTAGAAAIATLAATWPLLAIGALIAVVVAVIVLAVQHWGDITKWFQGIWGSFTSWFMGILGSIGSFFTGVWNGIVSFFVGIWNGLLGSARAAGTALSSWWSGLWSGIVSGLKAAWDFIVNAVKIGALIVLAVILAPFLAVGALFVWLYNHNTYVKELVDAIVSFFKNGIAWIQQAWSTVVSWLANLWQGIASKAQQIWGNITSAVQQASSTAGNWIHDRWTQASTWLGDRWNWISSTATSVWGNISSTVSQKSQQAGNWLQSTWTTASTWISTQWNKLAGFAQTAWQNVSTVFSSIWTAYISKPLQSLWTSITGWFTNLANGALNAGKNFINMLVNGIRSGVGAIWNAVVSIAQTIWRALGFHSPPPDGPAKDSDKWMTNLVNMLSSSLIAGQPKMVAAVAAVAQPLAQLAQPSTPLQGSGIAAANAAIAQAEQHFHIYIGDEQIAHVVGNKMMQEVRRRTGMKL